MWVPSITCDSLIIFGKVSLYFAQFWFEVKGGVSQNVQTPIVFSSLLYDESRFISTHNIHDIR